MENPINRMIYNICNHFIDQDENDFLNKKKIARSLVRIHNHKLEQYGDVSFTNLVNLWKKYAAALLPTGGAFIRALQIQLFRKPKDAEAERALKSFLESAATWIYPVERFEWQGERCALFLQRKTLIAELLRRVMTPSQRDGTSRNVYGEFKKNPLKRICLRRIPSGGMEDVSFYRAKLVDQTLRKVLDYSDWTVVDEPTATERSSLFLQVVSVRGLQQKNGPSSSAEGFERQYQSEFAPKYTLLKCGIVIDSTDGKLCRISTEEYMKLRSNDICLLAMHKYGLRMMDSGPFNAFIERLGLAAVTADLLEVKHSSPVQLIRNGQGSTKGAPFILYNSARIETLIRTFNQRVGEGVYGQLPSIDDVDFSLLTEEEEWRLVYCFIFTFPNLIEQCVEQLERGLCATHLIVRYLSDLVSLFSVYYRRVRILTDTREHLMPYVYARIYLIKAVREILNRTLALLDIEPVQFM